MKEPKKTFEKIIDENLPNRGNKQIPKSRKYRVPYRVNPKRKASRHIVIKMKVIKDKERMLRGAKKSKK